MSQTLKCRGKKTKILKAGNAVVVTLYNTAVVSFNDAQIVLSSGGWRTATTKTRINQASNEFKLGFSVWQKAGVWYVAHNGVEHVFFDGITLFR